MVLTGSAVAIALVAVIVAVIFATRGGGGNNRPPGFAAASASANETPPPESSPTESTPTETTATAPATVESSQVERVLGEYTRDYSNEDAGGLRSLFAEDLERHDGSKAPEDLAAAVATYEHQFGELHEPHYSLSETNVEPGSGEATARAHYSIASQQGTVTGVITFHLVAQDEKLLIDKLEIEPSH
jgi:hypothetical protein